MTTGFKQILITCLVVIIAIPLTGEVFAQGEEMVESTEVEVSPETQVTNDWYKTERISGNIQVGDFVVGPGKRELELNPGDTFTTEISVTNRISPNRTFKLEVEDITGSSDGSSAVSLTGSERGPYSIRDYVSFPNDTFTLDLGERARIPVTITIPKDAEPGGYYGSVLVSTIQNSVAEIDTAPRSPIIARVGSLIFLKVKGDSLTAGKTLSLATIGDSWWYEKGPIQMGILFENTGSVHVNPYGEIAVTNMLGEEVGFVELEPWFVLPNSLRLREISWDREFLLGRYTATAKVNRGYDDIVDEVVVTFWVLPWKIVGGTFLIIFIIIFSIRAFFRTFEFKRK